MGICESPNNQNQTQTAQINQTNLPTQANQTNQTSTINNSTGDNNIDLNKIPERFLGSTSNKNNSESNGILSNILGNTTQNNTQSNGVLGNILGNNTQNNTQSNGILGNIIGNNTQNAANTNDSTVTKVINYGIENKDVIINGAKQILGK